jgi:hypothetical protein
VNGRTIGLATVFLVAACSGTASTTTSPPQESTTTGVAPATTTTAPRSIDVPDGAMSIGDKLFPRIGNRGYDVDHYTLDLAYDPTHDMLDAVATIEATATGTISAFSLDFAGLSVGEVTVDGEPARFTTTADKLLIAPPAPTPGRGVHHDGRLQRRPASVAVGRVRRADRMVQHG